MTTNEADMIRATNVEELTEAREAGQRAIAELHEELSFRRHAVEQQIVEAGAELAGLAAERDTVRDELEHFIGLRDRLGIQLVESRGQAGNSQYASALFYNARGYGEDVRCAHICTIDFKYFLVKPLLSILEITMYRKTKYQIRMDMNWLQAQMDLHGLSQRDVAAKIGITEQMFSNVVAGRRLFKAAEVDAIRRMLGYTLPEDRPMAIAVAGKVAAGDHIQLVDDYMKGAGLYRIARPEWVPPHGIAAAEIDGASAEPWALPGDIIFWSRKAMAVFPEDLGRPVVAELSDGRIMLKRLASGSAKGLWSLLSINPTHQSFIDIELNWAARALPSLPKDQIHYL